MDRAIDRLFDDSKSKIDEIYSVMEDLILENNILQKNYDELEKRYIDLEEKFETYKMKGTLYQILGNGIEELYWSTSNGQEDFIRDSYIEFQEKVDNEEDFEDWFNKCFEMQIERVFVQEIYV